MKQGAVSPGLSRSGAVQAVRRGSVVVLTALALAGCSTAEPEPTTMPAPTTAPAPPVVEPEPGPDPGGDSEPPQMPEAMEVDDEAGAVAAAEYFMRLYAHVFASGDLEEWDRVSGQTCEFCANTRQVVDSTYGDGGSFTGGQMLDLEEIEVVGFDDELIIWGVQVRYDRAAGVQIDPDGSSHELPAESGYIVLDVAPSVRGWLLMGGQAQDGPVG